MQLYVLCYKILYMLLYLKYYTVWYDSVVYHMKQFDIEAHS